MDNSFFSKTKIAGLIFLFPLLAFGLSDEEKSRVCKELALKVIPQQRESGAARCVEYASIDCDRVERTVNETCRETSHYDSAIKYDVERGNLGSCKAAIIKRETQRSVCEGLRNECRDNKMIMHGTVAVTCKMFRDEFNKNACAEVEKEVKRIVAAEAAEKKKCAAVK